MLAVDINKGGLAGAASLGCETMAANLAEPAERDRVAAAGEGIDYLVNAAGIIRLKPIFEELKRRTLFVRYMVYEGYGDGLRLSVGTNAEIDRLLQELTAIV